MPPSVSRTAGVACVTFLVFVALKKRNKTAKSSASDGVVLPGVKKAAFKRDKFMAELRATLRIVLPRWRSKEGLYLGMHTLSLVARSFLSLVAVHMSGKVAQSIVDENPRQFVRVLLEWIALGIPAATCNSMIRYFENTLATLFRARLTGHLRTLYTRGQAYYAVDNLDSRIENVDQCLTEDVSNVCAKMAHLWSQVAKPLLDFVLITVQLVLMITRKPPGAKKAAISEGPSDTSVVALGTVVGLGTVALTGQALRWISPPFGRLAAQKAALEGELRYAHSRLVTNSEEVAFYGGHRLEESFLAVAYNRLHAHIIDVSKLQFLYHAVEGFLMKYVWQAAGMIMIAIPTFTAGAEAGVQAGEKASNFITAKTLLINIADAIERLLSSYKDVRELGGLLGRSQHLERVLQDVSEGRFVKATAAENVFDLTSRGIVKEGNSIIFDKVPIVTPLGDVLVKEMSFAVHPGMHTFVAGPNGCGKSSLFRTLGGLWPVYGGHVTRPGAGGLFYIPQRPYLTVGTLRDQIIYPDSREDMLAKNKTDDDLNKLLDVVQVRAVFEREGGWDAVNYWHDSLSGGEKQRVAMARLFYHKPQYAVLDECTSAVSFDVEGVMYDYAKELQITLLTVSHRDSLWKYHDHIIRFDGKGGYAFEKFEANARKMHDDGDSV